jgi:hypothetical protein
VRGTTASGIDSSIRHPRLLAGYLMPRHCISVAEAYGVSACAAASLVSLAEYLGSEDINLVLSQLLLTYSVTQARFVCPFDSWMNAFLPRIIALRSLKPFG